MKILVVRGSRVGRPGGINTTILNTSKELEKMGHQLFHFEATSHNRTLKKQFATYFEQISPDAVHIFTERGKGTAARNFCVSNKIPFTTAFVVNYEELTRLPKWIIWKYLKWFHRPSEKIHVTTPRVESLLRSKGFSQKIIN